MRTTAPTPSSQFFLFAQNPNPNPNRTLSHLFLLRHPNHRIPHFPLIRSFNPITTSAVTPSSPPLAPSRLRKLVIEFERLDSAAERMKRVLEYAAGMERFREEKKVMRNRVMGCVAQVWVEVRMDEEGKMRFEADSDSEIVRGFCACLVGVMDGAWPEEVLGVHVEELAAVFGGIGSGGVAWGNVLVSMQKRTRVLVAEREGRVVEEVFPSLVIDRDGVVAKGSYAEAQVKIVFHCLELSES